MLKLVGCLGAGVVAGMALLLGCSLLLLVPAAFLLNGGYGSGPCPVGEGAGTPSPTVLSGSAHSSYTVNERSRSLATPLPTSPPGLCFPGSGVGASVVAWAKAMADALYVNPACGGHISFPDCYYTWYTSRFPTPVVQYGNTVCPGCAAWANGTYQCVSFVRGAYSQVYPMRYSANAFDLWTLYATQKDWLEVPAGAASPGSRGMPEPGDVLIFKDSSVGHAAIVMSVSLPAGHALGRITFANANSVSPYTTMPLLPDLTVDTSSWPGYTAWGYLRPRGTANASQSLVRISQLDPAQYATSAEYTTWAYSACSAAAMTEVLNAYAGRTRYRIHDILVVEAAQGAITPQLGLTHPGGVADTLTHFGLHTLWGTSGLSLDQVIASAQAGYPVIVGFPPNLYAGGHILVVRGGDANMVAVADSSAHDYTALARSQFLAWWGGFYAIATP